jgi:uncharacterized membrane protein YedE/YeeE
MSNFTPLPALIGGLLIGLAAVLLLVLNGRIAGVSGIAAGLVSPPDAQAATGSRGWRVVFLLGLVAGAGGYVALGGAAALPRTGFPVWALLLSGLLTGYGTSLAGGCTSGHGVCGLARLSLRSLAAVAVFLGVAMATTFVARHLLGVGA